MSQEKTSFESSTETSSSYFGVTEAGIVTADNNTLATDNERSDPSIYPEHVQSEGKKLTVVPIADLIRDVGQEMKLVHAKWSKSFSESENFEEFFPQRSEKLIKEAIQLEENLRKHKENVRQRLQFLTKTLQTM